MQPQIKSSQRLNHVKIAQKEESPAALADECWSHQCTPTYPHPPQALTTLLFYFSRGMNSLMTNRTISFVENSKKYVFCGPFVCSLFIPPSCSLDADGSGIVGLAAIRKTALSETLIGIRFGEFERFNEPKRKYKTFLLQYKTFVLTVCIIVFV